MSKIKILPEILSNKIAAGEVVERPASVVKELVENSLDAGGTRIMVEVEKGGRSLIQVSDNGVGMGRDDALLSIERYATSKIFTDDDLFSIRTLGFRGEALPSIASVSRFILETKEEGREAGIRIFMEGGTIKDISDIGAPPGTLVSVRNLFFNTPARRKFMKSVGTEMGHIADTVSSIALGQPYVRFRLCHNGKTVKDWAAASDGLGRVTDVLGKETRNRLHRLESCGEDVAIHGWLASPEITRSTSRGVFVYVNGRFVRDRTIQHALFEGYEGRLMKGRFPVAVIFVTIRPDQVDVNVHPRKNEVRFVRQNAVHDLVADRVREVLNRADRNPGFRKTRVSSEPSHVSDPMPAYREAPLCENADQENPTPHSPLPASRFPQTPIWERKPFGDMRLIGQFRGTYVICESHEGLVLVDQHAAHERVLFEELMRSSGSPNGRNASQKLLIPETFDLNHREADILEKLRPSLGESGLEIEPFGGNSFAATSVPAILRDREIAPLIREITERIAEIGFSGGVEKVIRECLMLMACHAAIRAGQQLSEEQMRGLLRQLDQCENPSHCPHGRPTRIRWSVRFLEKSFKRVKG